MSVVFVVMLLTVLLSLIDGKLQVFLSTYFVCHVRLAKYNGQMCVVDGVEKACAEFLEEESFGSRNLPDRGSLKILDELLCVYRYLCDVGAAFDLLCVIYVEIIILCVLRVLVSLLDFFTVEV